MKYLKKLIFAIAFAPFLLTSCIGGEQELSDVVLLITPKNDSTLVAGSGEKIRFQIKLSTINAYVNRLVISSFDMDNGQSVLRDTIFAEHKKELNHSFIYTIPMFNKETAEVELSFVAEDDLGNQREIVRNISVKNSQYLMDELSPITIYAHNSYLPNALNFERITQPFITTYAPDSLKADIWINPDNAESSITWESQTGTKFIRYNDFNYPSATAASLQAIYTSSKRYDAVRDIKANDIIIVGHEDMVEGVFYVNNVISDANIQGECLQLSYKGVLIGQQK